MAAAVEVTAGTVTDRHARPASVWLGLVARPEPVNDPAARQVVRRQLDAHAIARVHPDPVAPHLPRGVAERLVAVVEADPEHAVPQRLDDLAGKLDLFFFLWHP